MRFAMVAASFSNPGRVSAPSVKNFSCHFHHESLPCCIEGFPVTNAKHLFAGESKLGGFILGPLERRIFEEVWSRKSLTVRELLADGNLRLAYTTVMTTLDRLFKKGLLDRAEEGRAFRYSARCAPADIPRLVAVTRMRRWIEAAAPSGLPLSCFVEAVSDHDVKLLDELRDLVESKRVKLKKQKEKRS
jgi:predicted transcriptional regulator